MRKTDGEKRKGEKEESLELQFHIITGIIILLLFAKQIYCALQATSQVFMFCSYITAATLLTALVRAEGGNYCRDS